MVGVKTLDSTEPLLAENPERYCMFPIKYRSIWEMYKKAEASFWTGESMSSLNLAMATRVPILSASLRFEAQ